jgi:hypothetical protein
MNARTLKVGKTIDVRPAIARNAISEVMALQQMCYL